MLKDAVTNPSKVTKYFEDILTQIAEKLVEVGKYFNEMSWPKAILTVGPAGGTILKKLGPKGMDELASMLEKSIPDIVGVIEAVLEKVMPALFACLGIYQILMKDEYKSEDSENKEETKTESVIRAFIKEVFQSHTFEPVVGDVVSNVNPGCKHYQSSGKIIQVHDLPHDAGKAASYECMNDGSTWDIGDVLTKTLDQLAPVKEKSPLEEKKSKNMKRTHKLLREYIRGIMNEAPASVADAAGSDDGIPKGEWVLLSPGDERMQAAAEDLFGMVKDTYA